MIDKSAIRFIQRLDSFSRAFARLDDLVRVFSEGSADLLFSIKESGLNVEIAREALIKRFEFTQELSWNLLKDYLSYQGETEISGSRDAYRKSLRLGLIDSECWMGMIADRNLSAHDYNDQKAAAICGRIISDYHPLMKKLLNDMQRLGKQIPREELL